MARGGMARFFKTMIWIICPPAMNLCPFINSWSFNMDLDHNHWAKDANGDFTVDLASQNQLANKNWLREDLIAAPSPLWPGASYIESDAIYHTEARMGRDHMYAESDWGSPGKRRNTNNLWND